MSHIWTQPKEELRHYARDQAAAAHARDSLAFGYVAGRGNHAKGSLSICSGRSGALRRAFSDAGRWPLPMQKRKDLVESEGGGKASNLPEAGWKFRLFRYSFLVEEESLVQFDAEEGDGSGDGLCRRKVLVVLNPERGSMTYEIVLRSEKMSASVENIHL